MMMKRVVRVAASAEAGWWRAAGRPLAAMLLLGLAACGQDEGQASREIRALMHAQFDQPQAPLVVAPLIVAGDHAVADWAQNEKGGRALLRREQGHWRIVLCAGDALRDVQVLQQAGVPEPDANQLSRRLVQAEQALSAEALQRFASFHGVVKMDARGEHPPH